MQSLIETQWFNFYYVLNYFLYMFFPVINLFLNWVYSNYSIHFTEGIVHTGSFILKLLELEQYCLHHFRCLFARVLECFPVSFWFLFWNTVIHNEFGWLSICVILHSYKILWTYYVSLCYFILCLGLVSTLSLNVPVKLCR